MKKSIIIILGLILLLTGCSKKEKIEYYDVPKPSETETHHSSTKNDTQTISDDELRQIDMEIAEENEKDPGDIKLPDNPTFQNMNRMIVYEFSDAFANKLNEMIDVVKFDSALQNYLEEQEIVYVGDTPELYVQGSVTVKCNEVLDDDNSFIIRVMLPGVPTISCTIIDKDNYEFEYIGNIR